MHRPVLISLLIHVLFFSTLFLLQQTINRPASPDQISEKIDLVYFSGAEIKQLKSPQKELEKQAEHSLNSAQNRPEVPTGKVYQPSVVAERTSLDMPDTPDQEVLALSSANDLQKMAPHQRPSVEPVSKLTPVRKDMTAFEQKGGSIQDAKAVMPKVFPKSKPLAHPTEQQAYTELPSTEVSYVEEPPAEEQQSVVKVLEGDANPRPMQRADEFLRTIKSSRSINEPPSDFGSRRLPGKKGRLEEANNHEVLASIIPSLKQRLPHTNQISSRTPIQTFTNRDLLGLSENNERTSKCQKPLRTTPAMLKKIRKWQMEVQSKRATIGGLLGNGNHFNTAARQVSITDLLSNQRQKYVLKTEVGDLRIADLLRNYEVSENDPTLLCLR